ncbi:hypothetical protein LCGC14_0371820 [marine sediment metagenome]|uniref:ArnR1-like winged helix-turn-helix domain-containing protein n=1 Tax=marine sediment metagenome TaxID=412755 RepID=A0A0F9T565_9ZZZZ
MNLLNKTGFYSTLRLLSSIPERGKITLKLFYVKFREDSYYNAFFRVKRALLDAKLIKITGRGLGRKICITLRGERVWSLMELVFKAIEGEVFYIER